MADWSKPTLTSTYTNFLSETTGRDVDLATQFQAGTATNIPTNSVRWNSGIGRWQLWSGTAWGELASTYNFTGVTCTSLSNTGNTTLGDSSADSVTSNASTWSFPNGATIGGTLTFSGSVNYTGALTVSGVAVITASGTATLTNKTYDAFATGNVFKFNGNSFACAAGTATITMPAVTDTLVARNTTDTLTNKTISGAAVGSSMNDNSGVAYELGWRDLPISSTTSGTLTAAERGKVVPMSAGVTLNPSVFAAGSTFVLYNDTAGALTVTQGSGMTLRFGTSTGNRTIAARTMATIWCRSSSEMIISGSGVV